MLMKSVMFKNIILFFQLAPSVRDKETKSWRPDLINEFEKHDPLYQKDILFLSPEPRTVDWLENYYSQLEWEQRYLEKADLIIFWVPRELIHMPAFTTNIEFGMYIMNQDKDLLYGRPDDSPKNKYLDYCYNKYRFLNPINNLGTMAGDIINKLITIKY